MNLWITVAAVLCTLLGLAGAAYYGSCTWAGRRFLREQGTFVAEHTPPVSILKSLKGVDAHMYAAFRSHCLLEYPEYEVLFGVNDMSDPAVALVQKLQQEFPGRPLRIVHCPEVLGTNGKISTLAQMLPHARYEHVLINDSDIVVTPDFLTRVMRYFVDPKVGMVTTLYRAIPGKTVWSKVEAIGISTDFMGGVLVAREMEHGVHFALGATMAMTRAALAKIGGLESVVDYLADDYELGVRISRAGYTVVLGDIEVETALPDYDFHGFWAHQLRWARNHKHLRTEQYFGLVVTFGLVGAVLAVIVAPHAWWTWTAFGITAAARLTAALTIGRGVLKCPNLLRDLWLIPLRDFAAMSVWLVSFAGNEVEWRGTKFLVKDGKLERI